MKAVVAALLSLAAVDAFAQTMYRCPDANGQVSFTDKPCTGGQHVVVRPNIIPSEGARQEVGLQRRAAQTASRAASTPPCRFASYSVGGATGKSLAEAARQECIDNHITGSNNRTAYEMWRDHRQIETARRSNIINAAPKQVMILNR
jgi:hypothetical protein